ncbi:metal-dependent phosphohydrolase [Verrucosispora sp. ts21]|uniref:HD domain-containing protein n=1 Tax=Verrucosispora sp. ts21 TaxID=2069341 RepID=UPI000C88126B|nr:metal-dependent phosphohydrolase [Verrucosispora sp. ts21]PMR59158.1 metal-dependent phosphohydrolase [Verrucosispora sp. ts21]
MAGLIERWRTTVRAAGASDPAAIEATGSELLERWREPHRHYHTVDHLTAVLDVVDRYASAGRRPDLVRLAAWCHDAVYDPRAPGDRNERDSAALADTLLTGAGLPGPEVAEVRRLVLLTAGHQVDPADADGVLLCDADLAVLAAAEPEYDRYASAIRREYAHVPPAAYRIGRAQVLTHLLALPSIFRLPRPATRWEPRARANLARELGTLQAADQDVTVD